MCSPGLLSLGNSSFKVVKSPSGLEMRLLFCFLSFYRLSPWDVFAVPCVTAASPSAWPLVSVTQVTFSAPVPWWRPALLPPATLHPGEQLPGEAGWGCQLARCPHGAPTEVSPAVQGPQRCLHCPGTTAERRCPRNLRSAWTPPGQPLAAVVRGLDPGCFSVHPSPPGRGWFV